MLTFFLRFEQIYLLYIGILILVVGLLIRSTWTTYPRYRYALVNAIKNAGHASAHPYKKILNTLRMLTFALLIFLMGQPQLVDPASKLPINGIDIVLVLDVSGSMKTQDCDDENNSRLDVAKREAIRFIHKRVNDAIGLVIFGRDAVSRCPITLDKKMLTSIVEELRIGIINAEETALVTGMVCAANRLKSSKATSKIMIVLTDGEPSEGDMRPDIIASIANQLNIKIYTVGIGSEEEQMMMHPLYGLIPAQKVNVKLLKNIATQTGGEFFMARNASDMRLIYDTIDQLETTQHDVPIFSYYRDLLYPLGLVAGFLVLLEIVVSTFVWFAL